MPDGGGGVASSFFCVFCSFLFGREADHEQEEDNNEEKKLQYNNTRALPFGGLHFLSCVHCLAPVGPSWLARTAPPALAGVSLTELILSP